MQTIKAFLIIDFITLALLGCSFDKAATKNLSDRDEEIIYLAKNGSMIDVFNVVKKQFSSEDVGYLKRRDFQYGEFGGQLKDCSDQYFYCLSGGINVAIPKAISGQEKWEFTNRICQTEEPLSNNDLTVISCKSFQWATRFTYSPHSGIIAYSISSDPNMEYELIGDRGLFHNKWSDSVSPDH